MAGPIRVGSYVTRSIGRLRRLYDRASDTVR
jgi:hypothetical protein